MPIPPHLPVHIPLGERYKSTVTKSAIKTVNCEHCGTTFQYTATRKAQGFGDSWLWLDNRGAELRAARSAERNCDKKLAKALDIVPCSYCGWFQRRMVWLGKWRRFIYPTSLSFPIAWILLFCGMFDANPQIENGFASTMTVLLVFAPICLGITWSFWYNPNRRI